MKKQRHAVLTILLLMVAVWSIRSDASDLAPDTDTLYVGDQATDMLRSFNADTGLSENFIITDATLHGPRALLIGGGELIVVNQNVSQPFNGDVRQYLLRTAAFAGPLVLSTDINAPFAPRGAVYLNGVLYVASLTNFDANTHKEVPGEVDAFAGNGKWLGRLTPPSGFASKFFPRGIVYRDGLLYVSSAPNLDVESGSAGTGGQVLKFDPRSLEFKGVFVDDKDGGKGRLNRPEGLVFGPHGKLYITSFQADPSDADSIRVYDRYGNFLHAILLDQPAPAPRAFAQALLFGPGGQLFVPISGNGPLTGQIRKYDVRAKPSYPYTLFVPASLTGGPLKSPDYLTFGRTNPATLEYGSLSNLWDNWLD